MQIVYQGEEGHASLREVQDEVDKWRTLGDCLSDAVAQTIASWWHSPAEPNSTRLSTMGIVTADMNFYNFATDAEYEAAAEDDRNALDALADYIMVKQVDAGMLECAECYEIAFVTNGICKECAE
jgi:hypothetical protein